jgi:type IV pilus assembly protein PilY1
VDPEFAMTTSLPTGWLQTLRTAATRCLVYFICLTNALPAWSATTLVQEPPFTATQPAANLFLMLDDSGSMGDHQLPRPAGVTLVGSAGTTVTMTGLGADSAGAWATRSWPISRDFDWVLRAPALNPLWYNPATRYRPWNKDGVPLPNASIGGSAAGTNQGEFTSRANPLQLTERDPRQVPVGSSYVSVSTGAGRGLLGTDMLNLTSPMSQGRRVTLASPSADFRYYKMPFDFGPTLSGATTAPRNGHADMAWTVHNDTTSPLDLFSRPLTSTTATIRTGCFTNSAQCLAGTAASAPILTTTWTRNNCDGTPVTYGSDPGPLTCHRARCGPTGAWSAWSPSPVTLSCAWTWTSCTGVAQSSPTNPGPINCGWRRTNCSGTVESFGANPGPLTCYRTRSCATGSVWSGYSATNPGVLPACFTRQNCAGTTQFFSGTNPGSLTCDWTRPDCFGVPQTFTGPSPGNLTCYKRTTCAGVVQNFTTNQPSLVCGYTRNTCPNVLTNFASDPGPLTCYARSNCDGSTTGPTETVLSPLSCVSFGELPVLYNVTTTTRTVTTLLNNTTTFTQSPTGGGIKNPFAYSRIQTANIAPVAPSTITPVQLTQVNGTQTNSSSSSTTSACPGGTSTLTCTIPAPMGVPEAGSLTPARYYAYTGSGNKGDPANYRVFQIDRTRPSSYLYPVVDAATGVAPSAASSQRTDCAALTSCTWAEEAQNYANWYLYYRNRLFAAQAVMADAMSSLTSSSQQRMRVGYGRINYFAGAFNPWRTVPMETIGALPNIDGAANPGALVRGVRAFGGGTPSRSQFFDWLFSLSWVGATPNREAIDSVGRYFTRNDNSGPWGSVPGINDAAPQVACRRNFAFLTTDGEWTNVAAGQPLIGGTAPLAGSGSPIESDNVAGPTILGDGINDGATFTYAPATWPQFTGGANQSSTLTDAAVYYWNHDLRPDLPNTVQPITDALRPNPAFWQSMSTYIVGYGLSASMDTAATRTAAYTGTSVTWPTVDMTNTIITGGNRVNDNLRAALASRGNFYAAADTGELRTSILAAFSEIEKRQGSAGGVAVTGPAITGATQVYFPSYTTGSWSGALRAYATADLQQLAMGNVVTPLWSATVPAHATRNVLTSTARTTAVTFTTGNLNAAQTALLTSPDYTTAEIVNYLRGDNSLELPASGSPAGKKFRRRETLLGDFVNSTPLYVKAPDYGFGVMQSIGASYASFVAGRRTGPSAVYIGGNAGMFHGFDATTGVERFAYVPRGIYTDLGLLSNPAYDHRYFVDGPVTGGDFHDGSAWRSVVVGTTGAGGGNATGGGSIFAIDVTNPAAVGSSKVLWDITKGDSNDVGHVLNRGVVGRVRTGESTFKWVYITGNGYESVNNRAALLVVDIATGALTSIPVGPNWSAADGLEARNGMGGVTVSYDAQRTITGVYAGDRQGNLWRFDFSSNVPTGAKGFDNTNSPLFTASVGARRLPISAAPRLVAHPKGGMYVVFGTGKLHDQDDSLVTDSQALYGLWLKPDRTTQALTTDMASISMTSPSADSRTFSLAGIDWATKMGWMVSLTGGERIISDPSSDLGSLSISSFKPVTSTSCEGGGTSFVYRFDYATGTVTGSAVSGVVGALTPLVTLPTSIRDKSSVNPQTMMTGSPTDAVGNPQSSSQCLMYSTSIQGRPNVIAQNCSGFSPIRVWRQSVR